MSLETRIIALATAIGADIKALTGKQGDLTALTTTTKVSLVAALNELDTLQGDLTALSTTAKGNIVAALNEIVSNMGTLTSLTTTAKSSLVLALNELVGRINSLESTGAGTYTNAGATPTTIGGIAAGSTFNTKTWQQMFDSLLYPYQLPAFTAFSFTGFTTPLEVGATVAASRTFTWTASNGGNINANSIKVQYPVGTDLATGLANDGTELVANGAVTLNAPGTAIFRVIGVNSQAANFQRDLTVEWRWMRYSGNSASAGPLDQTAVKALATASLQTDDAATYIYGAAAGTYKYIACPTTFGTLTTFKDQSTNLDVPMEAPYVVSVTNTNGQTTNYNVYRSTNQLGAAINIIAS